MRAVENAMAEIAGQRRHPGAAQNPAQIAQRVPAANPSPVGKRGASQQDRPGQFRPGRRHHHDLPAGLAIGDDNRLALGLRVQGRHPFHKHRFRPADILDGLAFHGGRQESHEIAGMAGLQRHADLAFLLHAADARTMAGTWIDNDEGDFGRIGPGSLRWHDPDQEIVHRPGQRAAIQHQIRLIIEHMRNLAGIMFSIDIPALA